ncbi:MAG: hypothetical protein Kow0031_20400 [Anaerolineae bacterium]
MVLVGNNVTIVQYGHIWSKTIKRLFSGEIPLWQNKRWADYAISFGLVVLVTVVGLPLAPLDHANIVMLYLLAEVIAATRFGLGPSILAALTSVLAYHYFFIVPRFTFAIAEAQYLLVFVGLLVVGLVVSTLTATVREQARAADRRERQTAASYQFSRALAASATLEEILNATLANIRQVFNRQVIVLLPHADSQQLQLHTDAAGFTIDDHDYAVANWVFQNCRPAGRGTATLPGSAMRYHPLHTARGVVGVLGVMPPPAHGHLSTEQSHLLEAFASQAAVALERIQLAERARHTQMLQDREKLQTALLNSISHDLRTPLASITGTLGSLREDDAALNAATRRELIENAWEEADRMNRLVGNLLNMTRLEAGAVRLSRQPCDVQDLLGAALNMLDQRFQSRPIPIEIPPDLPLVSLDFVLMTHVLVNVIDNACKYSPANSPVTIKVQRADSSIQLTVSDQGPGIPARDLERVFEKFYRVPHNHRVGGAGLGLSICRGLVEAHHGKIWAENNPNGGAAIHILLPEDAVSKVKPL